jgi:antitoxin CcdA
MKRHARITLPSSLLDEARALGINVSEAAESGVAQAVAGKRAEHWQHENGQAIQSSNSYVEQHGLPLARYRMF